MYVQGGDVHISTPLYLTHLTSHLTPYTPPLHPPMSNPHPSTPHNREEIRLDGTGSDVMTERQGSNTPWASCLSFLLYYIQLYSTTSPLYYSPPSLYTHPHDPFTPFNTSYATFTPRLHTQPGDHPSLYQPGQPASPTHHSPLTTLSPQLTPLHSLPSYLSHPPTHSISHKPKKAPLHAPRSLHFGHLALSSATTTIPASQHPSITHHPPTIPYHTSIPMPMS